MKLFNRPRFKAVFRPQTSALAAKWGAGLRLSLSLVLVLILSTSLFLTGCTSKDDSTSSDGSTTATSLTELFDASLLDLSYTDRDQDPSYDEDEACIITLEGDTASISGDGASIDGSCVTIEQEGTYIVSGSLSDGQLVVEVSDEEKVQVVLDGVDIHNEDGPAIYVKNADKVFITLADGSSNQLSDGSSYTLEDDSDEPYATLFSKDDLTINGTGTLSVEASYRHAICSKDDLVITGGTYNITAVEDGLRGRDCVKIADGTFSIEAGRDGIKSNNDEDAERGFVSIDGGSFSITAGDEGIQAVTYIRIAAGSFDITAEDDALHSDIEGYISGGELNIVAGDDAIHTETVLTIDGGSIDISDCYEGLESEKIYLNDGEVHIVARDDGINAASAEEVLVSDEDEDDTSSDDSSSSDEANSDTSSSDEASSDTSSSTFSTEVGDTSDAIDLDAAQDTDVDSAFSQTPQAGDGSESAGGALGDEMPDGEGQTDAQMDEMGTASDVDDVSQPSGGAPAFDSDSEEDGLGGDINESVQQGGAPDNAFAEAGAGMGDENCLLQINGGYYVVEAAGDGLDSNGYIEINGGVVLVSGPESGDDGALDYDLSASISGGTVILAGSSGMAQNFTEGDQAFAFVSLNGSANSSIAICDEEGTVLASYTLPKGFGCVVVSTPGMEEGGTYTLVLGGTVENANEDGYADSGSVSGGESTSFEASTTASAGLGGLGADGTGLPAGQQGDVRITAR